MYIYGYIYILYIAMRKLKTPNRGIARAHPFGSFSQMFPVHATCEM